MQKIIDDKIKRYIDELGEEYKDILLEELVKKSSITDELSVSELIRIDEDVKYYMRTKDQMKRKRKFYQLGLMYIVLAIYIYLFANIMYSFENLNYLSTYALIQLMAIVIGMTGLMVVVTEYMRGNKKNYSKIKKSEDMNEKRKFIEYEVICLWRELEGLFNDISVSRGTIIGPRTIIDYFDKEGLITDEEKVTLIRFLKLRNIIVHDNMRTLSIEELSNEVKKVRKIYDKVKNKVSKL